ncbi:hypothetical protein BVC80_1117g79 [Macleaya cordata]|uniref:Uncharacterized protein n=1 Tax=Macleaya cordata TaxID=56857 RepID=A0A200Q9F2_MACCD|nr:hypothetical protein BVC80_1117g79 [Macleaya cordata]
MPDRFLQTCHDGDAKAWRSEHSYESVWMAHWMQTSCNAASRVRNRFVLHDGCKEEDCNTNKGAMLVQSADPRKAARLEVIVGPSNASDCRNTWSGQQGSLKVASDAPSSAKADGAETEDGGAKITNDKLAMNSGSLSNTRSEWHSFPMSAGLNQNNGSALTPIKELAFCDRHVSKSQIKDNSGNGSTIVGTSGTNFPSRLCRLASKEVEFPSKDHYLVQFGKSYESVEKKSLPVSKPFLYDLPGSTSNTVSYKYKSRGTPVRSFMCRNKETDQSICQVASKDCSTNSHLTPLEQENYNYSSYPTFWGCDKGKDNQLKAKDSGTSCLMQTDGTNDPSASNFNFLLSVGEQGKAMNGFSGTEVSSSCSSPQRVTKLEELNLGSHLLQKVPACSVHDVETLRICTAVDSVEGVSGGPPKFSQATHHLFITKNTGVNLSKWGQILRESKLSANFKQNALHELFSLPSHCHGKRGPKLQSLENSTNSEGKEDTVHVEKDCLCLKKELSAGTDAMDIDDCDTRNSSQGIASSPSTEDLVVGRNPVSAQATFVSPRKVGSRKTEMEIPAISRDSPVILAEKGLRGKRDLGTSRTESLGVEHLLSHIEPPVCVNSSASQDVPEVQPSNRLVKRLKLSASDSLAYGVKSSGTGDTSSGEKVNKLFAKIMSYNINISDPTLSKHLGRRQMELDKSVVLFRNSECPCMGPMKENQDLILSHPWIQRWCRSQAEVPLIKPAAPVVCEPQVSKPTSRKQLPSIAAMALMGKASYSYRPCEFRKRGPVVVWNTEGF